MFQQHFSKCFSLCYFNSNNLYQLQEKNQLSLVLKVLVSHHDIELVSPITQKRRQRPSWAGNLPRLWGWSVKEQRHSFPVLASNNSISLLLVWNWENAEFLDKRPSLACTRSELKKDGVLHSGSYQMDQMQMKHWNYVTF